MKVLKYRRGQIWYYKMSNGFDGSVQGKDRPVIIISNDLANEYSGCLLAIPCTTADKKYMPTHTIFWIDGIKNIALAENLMSINKDKLIDYIGTVDDELLSKLESTISIALGLNRVVNQKEEIVENTLEQIKAEEKTEDTGVYKLTEKGKELVQTTIASGKLKRGRKPKYSDSEKKLLIEDYKNFGIAYVMSKYKESSKVALTKKIERYRRELGI